MVETEIDEYKIKTNQGKKQLTLKVSLKNNRVSMIVKNLDNPKLKFSNYIRLEQFRNACEVFDNTKVNTETLKSLGARGIINKEGIVQVIIGPEADLINDEIHQVMEK